jgi:hypothetical protein
MPRCRHCRTLLRRDPEEIGARCPRCREPLFEQAGSPEQIDPEQPGMEKEGETSESEREMGRAAPPPSLSSSPARKVREGATKALCAIHRRNLARGTCQRCGNYLCSVCRTRLRGQTLCPACVERILESQEATPQDARAHLLQAILALVLGIIGWVVVLLGIIVIGVGASSESVVLIGVGGFILLVSPLAAVFGAGQGAAAIRTRGDHMILATIGLLLSAFQIGAVIGLVTFSVLLNN